MTSPILTLTQQEARRHKHSINLIASENYPSPTTLDLLGSTWSLKYAEGYAGKRYYAGQVYTDQLELYVKERALEVFDITGGEYDVNVQVLSGSPANGMVFMTVLEYGDTVLSLNLANGGHLSHMHQTSNWLKFFKHVTYDVAQTEQDVWEIDTTDFENQLKAHRPKLVIIGFSAYPRAYKFEKMIELAHEYGALVLADIAHINGLIAAGLHDSPFGVGLKGADFVSMTTHKTLRGPRGAMLFAKKEHIDQLNKTIFPGMSGGPHVNKIAAIGNCLDEILGNVAYPDNRSFVDYSRAVLANAHALEAGLSAAGLDIISPSQTHLSLVRLPADCDSLEAQRQLEVLNIISNRNMIPNDTKSPWKPSGMRFGTAAITSRGMNESDCRELGELIGHICLGTQVNESKILQLIEAQKWYFS